MEQLTPVAEELELVVTRPPKYLKTKEQAETADQVWSSFDTP
jgi:hypothetical protein